MNYLPISVDVRISGNVGKIEQVGNMLNPRALCTGKRWWDMGQHREGDLRVILEEAVIRLGDVWIAT